MELYYHKTDRKNFGDDLNEWLWDRVLPGWQEMASPKHTLFGVGSILHHNLLERSEHPIVFGSGYNQGPLPQPDLRMRTDFRAIRGPLTKAAVGLSGEIPMGDPAILISDLLPKAPATQDILFVPHHHSLPPQQELIDLDTVAQEAGMRLLSPMGESIEVISQISSAKLVITESLHGAILADSYRVPWICAKLGPQFTPYKWQDWTGSLEMPFEVHDLVPGINFSARAYNIARRRLLPKSPNIFDWRRGYLPGRGLIRTRLVAALKQLATQQPQLSRDAVLSTQKARLFEALDQLAQAYRGSS